jgi:hypothetical protein
MSFSVHFGAGAMVSAESANLSLQGALSSASAGASDVAVLPHHPITCQSSLEFHGDGRLSCEHATAPPGEVRTQLCLDHSVAILLLELARQL